MFFLVDNTNILEQSIGEFPMFKTGSGKLAPLEQSSIMRAMAVIGEGDLLEKGKLFNMLFEFHFSALIF